MPFKSLINWTNVSSSRDKPKKEGGWSSASGVSQEKAEKTQAGVRAAGAMSPMEAIKSQMANLMGKKNKS